MSVYYYGEQPVGFVMPPIQARVKQDLISIMKLNQEIREKLLEGDKVDIYVGDHLVFAALPKKAFMAVSGLAHEHFLANPQVAYLELTWGTVNIVALKHVCHWINSVCAKGKTYAIPPGNNLSMAASIVHLGHVLGMDQYTTHIEKKVRDTISDRLLDYTELDAVLATFAEGTAIFTHLAHNLAHARHNNRIPDADNFEIYLSNHPALNQLMAAIDYDRQVKQQLKEAATQGHNAQGEQAKSGKKKKTKYFNRKARKEQQKKEQEQLEEEVKEKLNTGGIHMMTEEQAQAYRDMVGR